VEDRDISIVTQVAFKEASAQAIALGLNVTVPEHQAVFEHIFSNLSESLLKGIQGNLGFSPDATARVVQAFPGATDVTPGIQPPHMIPGNQPPVAASYGAPQAQAQPLPQFGYPVPRIKGQSTGAPIPDWALKAMYEAGVQEVYDNRGSLATNPKRPWFKATTGGDNAPAFWPPDR
jgi:hypothetical protein